MDLQNITVDRATCIVYFYGEEAKVTYRPLAITAELVAKGFSQDDATGDAFFDMFSTLIVDWDVKNGGKKVKIDKESLSKVPMSFLRAVYEAIMKDAASGEAGKPSNAG